MGKAYNRATLVEQFRSCWRFRPGKPYVLAVLKWSVLQYCFVRPLISIAGIICQACWRWAAGREQGRSRPAQAFNVLCEDIYSVHFAQVYLEAVDFVSISVALEGLIVLYTTLRTTLAGRRPLAKFLAIKIVIVRSGTRLHAVPSPARSFSLSIRASYTAPWPSTASSRRRTTGTPTSALTPLESALIVCRTSTNIAQGLQALTTTIECVLFAGYNFWAFPPREYRHLREAGAKPTNVFRAFLHSQNYCA